MNQSILSGTNIIINEVFRQKQVLDKHDKDILYITDVCNRNVTHLDLLLSQAHTKVESQVERILDDIKIIQNDIAQLRDRLAIYENSERSNAFVTLTTSSVNESHNDTSTICRQFNTLKADYKPMKKPKRPKPPKPLPPLSLNSVESHCNKHPRLIHNDNRGLRRSERLKKR